MPPRTLASLAHALGAAPDLGAALVALGEALLEVDRSAQLALFRFDERRSMLSERLTPAGGRAVRSASETAFDHLAGPVRLSVAAGGDFVDLGDRSAEYARLFGFPPIVDGVLSLRGLRFENGLAAVLALHEPKKIFGTRAAERFAPSVALFDLGFARFAEREAREEAVRTLEDVTQRVHGEYVRKLAGLEQQLGEARGEAARGVDVARHVQLEKDSAASAEEARKARRNLAVVEHQVGAAVEQLEKAHIELHRRSEALRQKTRTLYLIDRVLTLDAQADEPRALVDGLLRLVGDDMQAQRCSLMLRAPDGLTLYLAAARGLSPRILEEGVTVRIGEGVAGRVAQSRSPLIVEDVTEATSHPLLGDQYFTTGSFISFPLVYHGDLVGVLNLTNRAQRGVYTEDDAERVRLLALVVSLVATNTGLAERLAGLPLAG